MVTLYLLYLFTNIRSLIIITGLGILRFSSYQYHPHGKICLGSLVDFVDLDDSLLSNLSTKSYFSLQYYY